MYSSSKGSIKQEKKNMSQLPTDLVTPHHTERGSPPFSPGEREGKCPVQSRTLSLSLSLTHTHTLSLSQPFYPPRPIFLSISAQSGGPVPDIYTNANARSGREEKKIERAIQIQ
jgi:hypothetical protein